MKPTQVSRMERPLDRRCPNAHEVKQPQPGNEVGPKLLQVYCTESHIVPDDMFYVVIQMSASNSKALVLHTKLTIRLRFVGNETKKQKSNSHVNKQDVELMILWL